MWVNAVFLLTRGAFQPKGYFPRYGSLHGPPVEYSALTQYKTLAYMKTVKGSSKMKSRDIPLFLTKKATEKVMNENLWTVWNGWGMQGRALPPTNPMPNSMKGFVKLGTTTGTAGAIDYFELGVGNSSTMLGEFDFEGPTRAWIQLCGDGFKPSDSKWKIPPIDKTIIVGDANEYGKEGKGSLDEYFTFQLGETTVSNFPMQPGYTYLFTDAADSDSPGGLRKGMNIWFLTYADIPKTQIISKFEDDNGLFPTSTHNQPPDNRKHPAQPAIYGIRFTCEVGGGNKWSAKIQNLTYSDLLEPQLGGKGASAFRDRKYFFPQPPWNTPRVEDKINNGVVFRNAEVNSMLQLQPLERHQYIADLKSAGLKGQMALYHGAGIVVANFAVVTKGGWRRVFKKELDKKYPPPPKQFKPPHSAAAASESSLEDKETLEWIKENYGSGVHDK
jgi:hypothetical protein